MVVMVMMVMAMAAAAAVNTLSLSLGRQEAPRLRPACQAARRSRLAGKRPAAARTHGLATALHALHHLDRLEVSWLR